MNAYDSKHLKTAQLHRLITILSKIWLHKRMKLSLHTTCRAKRRIKSDKQKKKKSSFGRGRKCAKITDLLTWGWEKTEQHGVFRGCSASKHVRLATTVHCAAISYSTWTCSRLHVTHWLTLYCWLPPAHERHVKDDFPTLKCINLVFWIFRVETILLFLKPNKWFRKPVNHWTATMRWSHCNSLLRFLWSCCIIMCWFFASRLCICAECALVECMSAALRLCWMVFRVGLWL